MRQQKYVPRRMNELAECPFDSAEEAWLWFSQCQIARDEGSMRTGRGETSRPCDPADIYRAVIALHRRRVIGQGHLAVLGRFGRRLHPPDPHSDTPWEVSLWAESLDRLTTVLRGKGIVR